MWSAGCFCHEAELLAGKKIDCPAKGLRLPELFTKINRVVGELRTKAIGIDQTLPFFREAIHCCEYGAGLLRARCDFLDKLPYSLVRCRVRAIAQQCLQEFDNLTDLEKTEAHRVTREFCGDLRDDLAQWAAGGDMSERLNQVLAPHELVRMRLGWILPADPELTISCFQFEGLWVWFWANPGSLQTDGGWLRSN
jgi:hypothetical protein